MNTRIAGIGMTSERTRMRMISRLREQGIMDEVNSSYAQVEQVKKFTILDRDLSIDTGELTPTLKVKRNVIYDRYSELFESMY